MRILIGITLISLICFTFSGCSTEPPDIDKAEKVFRENYDDIMLVVDYMLGTDYEDISFSYVDKYGMMWADFADVEIGDKDVADAVDRLKDDYFSIYKSGNTIEMGWWRPFMKEVHSGFAYSINGGIPDIQYMTEYYPMSTSGWYYYVADYNKWRSENS